MPSEEVLLNYLENNRRKNEGGTMKPFTYNMFTYPMNRIIVIFLAIFWSTHLHSEDTLLSKKKLKIVSAVNNEAPYFKSATGMKYLEGFLYYVENAYHKVLKYKYNTDDLFFESSIGRRGQGPGDLYLPIAIKSYKGDLVVSDNNKISFFDVNGKFIRNFNHFSVGTEILALDDKVFLLSPKPHKNSLLKIYSLRGELLGYGGQKVITPVSRARNIAMQDKVIYKGTLLTNDGHIDYVSKLFGILQRIDTSGKVIFSKDISGLFSKVLQERKERNEKLFLEGGFNFDKKGVLRIPSIPIFQGACVEGDYIYFLGPVLAPKEYQGKKYVDIRAINKTSLELYKVYKLFLDHERDSVILFDIKETDSHGKTVFITMIETEANGFEFYELSEKEINQ
jgi:hypothetical protein